VRHVALASVALASLVAVIHCTSTDDLAGGSPPPDAAPETAGACPEGFGDCDRDPANGCEAKLDEDTSHCGACGTVCPARANGYPICLAGTCRIGCNDGFDNCDGNDANGCELPVLTNPANCGGCNHACDGACSEGLCDPVQLASGQLGAFGIEVDGARVYWTVATAGAVRSHTKIPSGLAIVNVASNQTNARSVVLDRDASVYWTWEGGIGACPTTGFCLDASFVPYTDTSGPVVAGLTIDFTEGNLYFQRNGYIRRTPLSGGDGAPPEDIGSLTAVFELTPSTLAVSRDRVFVTNANVVRWRDKTGGGGGVITPAPIAAAVAVYGDWLYWTDRDAVRRCPAASCDGGQVITNAPDGRPQALVVDGTYVYWAIAGTTANQLVDGKIVRCPITGCVGRPLMLAKLQHDPRGVAIDEKFVYWTNFGDGRIMKVER
jgi:hypothetical protein